MGIFDFFKRNKDQKDSQKNEQNQNPNAEADFKEMDRETLNEVITIIDRPIEESLVSNVNFYKDAICPYCSSKLDKSPLRKTKCPYCHNYIFVRTNMITNEKMLLTEEQVNKLEAERQKVSIIESILMNDSGIRAEFKKVKDELKNENKKAPDMDILWGLLNEKSSEYAKRNLWGLFRNTRYDMLEILNAEGRLEDALGMALEVCYYDINGPNNITTNNPAILKEFPPFDPELGFVAPALVFSIKELKDKLNLKWEDIKDLFLKRANQVRMSIMRVSPKKAWDILYDEIKDEGETLE
jgi:hypothetical protein